MSTANPPPAYVAPPLHARLAAARARENPADARSARVLGSAAAGALGLGLALLASGANAGVFHALNEGGRAIPAPVWAGVTYLGNGVTAAAATLFWVRRRPEIVWTALWTALLAGLYSRGLKELADVARPAAALDPASFRQIGPVLRAHALPSGHSVTVFALWGVLYHYVRSRALCATLFALAALVALSRVMVGVHWPADVAIGAAGGLAVAWAGVRLAHRWPLGLRPRAHLALVAVLSGVALFVAADAAAPPAARCVGLPIAAAALGQVLRAYGPSLTRARPPAAPHRGRRAPG